MRLLDLYCGAGGAARGYQQAGFHVTGIDIHPQPRYAGDIFIQADALQYLAQHGHAYDAIHASPPCQAYSATRTMWNNRGNHPELVHPTRELLLQTHRPWVMENVPGAPLTSHIILCGTMFNLTIDDEWELRRHRLFETMGVFCLTPPCRHGIRPTLGVYGNGGGGKMTRGTKATITQARQIMDIDWMTTAEISQAIPPAYTRHIGQQLIKLINVS